MHHRHTTLATLTVLALAVTGVRAEPQAYAEFELEARSAFTGAFRLPDGAFFTNATIQVSSAGDVAFEVFDLPGGLGSGIWFARGDDPSGGTVVHVAPASASLTDPSVNDVGIAVWGETSSSPSGLWEYDSTTGLVSFLTAEPPGASSWEEPTTNDAGEIGFRADLGFTGQTWEVWEPTSGITRLVAAENGVDPLSPYSFLFGPTLAADGALAGKVLLDGLAGNDPAQILRFEADGTRIVIAETDDVDPASSFDRFDNSVDVNADGQVAFITTLVGGDRAVYLGDGTTLIELANTATTSILSDVEFFAPALNATGQVAFRGVDEVGLQAVFVADVEGIERVIGEHDLVQSDLGLARLDQNDDTSPVFGGGVTLNDAGDVAFAAGLTPPGDDQIEWGTGAFVARAGALRLGVGELRPGADALFTITAATPGAEVSLAFSATGPGTFPVPPLGVTLDLDSPTRIATAVADAEGVAEIGITVPNGVPAPADVWFQAVEPGNKSAFVATQVVP